MRSKIKIVQDPKIIYAWFSMYRPVDKKKIIPSLYMSQRAHIKMLKIKVSTNKMKCGMELDQNKLNALGKQAERIIIDNLKHSSYMSYSQKPIWFDFRIIWCHKNKKTHYKEYIYLLRNPHAAIMYLNSDIPHLQTLAQFIVQGYKVIFPRETRFYGNNFPV